MPDFLAQRERSKERATVEHSIFLLSCKHGRSVFGEDRGHVLVHVMKCMALNSGVTVGGKVRLITPGFLFWLFFFFGQFFYF